MKSIMKGKLHFLYIILFYILIYKSYSQNPNWVSGIRAGGAKAEEGMDIVMDLSGNVYVTGYFTSSSITFGSFTLINADNTGNTSDMFVVKFDKNYNVIWAKRAGNPTRHDMGRSIAVDKNGNVLITGMFGISISFGSISIIGSNLADAFVVKYDQNGIELWANSVKGLTNEQGRCITTDVSGNVFITGSFSSSALHFGTDTIINSSSGNDDDFFIAKYDASGSFLWARAAGGSNPFGSRNDVGISISSDGNGNSYVAGQFECSKIGFDTDTLTNTLEGYKDIFVVCYNSNGGVVWARKAGGNYDDYLNSIKTNTNGEVVIAGYFNSINSTFGTLVLNKQGNSDGYLARYDQTGNELWVNNQGYNNSAISTNDLFIDVNDNVYATGYFSSSLIVANDTLNTNGGSDIFVTKYDNFGNNTWGISAGGNSLDWSYSIAGDATDLFITGMFMSSNLQFNTSILSCVGSQDFFLSRINLLTTDILERNNQNSLTISPNPNAGIFYVNTKSTIEVLNMLGQKIGNYESSNNHMQIDLSNQPNGIYYIGLIDKTIGEKTYRKIIIER